MVDETWLYQADIWPKSAPAFGVVILDFPTDDESVGRATPMERAVCLAVEIGSVLA